MEPIEAPLSKRSEANAKKGLKKLETNAKKLELKNQRKAEQDKADLEKQQQRLAEDTANAHLYGVYPLINSSTRNHMVFHKIADISPTNSGQILRIRARLHSVRKNGGMCFLTVRQSMDSAQIVVSGPKAMVKFSMDLSVESIIEVTGTVSVPDEEIVSVTHGKAEIQALTVHVVSVSDKVLPFGLPDAQRPEHMIEESHQVHRDYSSRIAELKEKGANTSDLEKEKEEKPFYVGVGQAIRLNNRVLDMRTTTTQAIFRVSAATCRLFRQFLDARGFTELFFPKLIGTASEGGSEVFKVDFFGSPAYLAQSPQLYKQMAISGDFPGVYSIGPVFRAENSQTHRHMCEFTGIDFEMPVLEHYGEVLDTIDGLFRYIFDGLKKQCSKEIEAIRRQFPFTDLRYLDKTLVLDFKDGIQLLKDDGIQIGDYDDLNTKLEQRLGHIVSTKYGTDFYILNKFPAAIRPFYTMGCPNDPLYSNSYDVMIRGEEVCSGAQRIHDANLLEQSCKNKNIDPSTLNYYIDAFKYGCVPHGGGGIGLERVVMLYFGLSNIRKTVLFPRDSGRLTP